MKKSVSSFLGSFLALLLFFLIFTAFGALAALMIVVGSLGVRAERRGVLPSALSSLFLLQNGNKKGTG